MQLLDVNVLVHAHRRDALRHEEYKAFLLGLVDGDEAFGVPDLALSGFLRIVTHPRIFDPPSDLADALAFAEQVRASPRRIDVIPGGAWSIFVRLCRDANARGNLVPDAWFAALAIESGSGSQRTGTSLASPACAGGIRS